MALPKEPRQKMINIMYLVLTAILALNVSSEILNAFKTIDDSFGKSSDGLAKRSAKLISDFDAEANSKFPEKVATWKPRAEKVKEISEALYTQIENLKAELKKESGQKTPNGEFKEDDLEATTRLFVNGKEGESKGELLYAALVKYKQDLANIDSLKKPVSNLPDFLTVPKSSNSNAAQLSLTPAQQWSNVYFHMTPTVAALAMLSKFQNDIRNSQTQLIEYCYSQINSVSLPIPNFGAIANASSTMVMAGDELTITAGLGAYNKDAKPIITIDGAGVPLGPDGQGVYKMTASGSGEYSKHVTITYNDPTTGKQETKSTDVKFKVGVPTGLAVSTDKTRVFYIGAPGGNPLSVSGAAGGAGSIKVNVVSGPATVSTSSTPGVFNVVTTAVGEVVLSVTDGKTTTKVTVPSKKLPDPQYAYVYGTLNENTGTGGVVSADAFKKNQTGISTKLPADFVFKDVTYSVKSFTMQFSGKGFTGTESINISGSLLSGARKLLDRCEPGSTVSITDIVAEDAGKQEHKLKNTIGFYLK